MDRTVEPPLLLEGDYIETVEGMFFAVKGLVHPEGRVIAYLRYIPDARGERSRGRQRYRRVYDLEETTEFLEREHPQYLSWVETVGLTLQTVPEERIAKIYKTRDKLSSLITCPENEIEKTLAMFVSNLSSYSGVPMANFGVSGSILIGLTSPDSDIDLVVYGEEAGQKAYTGLRRLREVHEWISPYDVRTVEKVVKARWGDTEFGLDKLTDIEVEKVLHGRVCGRDYFVRLVKGPNEVEEEIASRPISEVKLRAVVVEAGSSIFTPCTYRVMGCVFIDTPRSQEASELMSFRGKFAEQVKEGDAVEAMGTLEEVKYSDKTIHRVMLGRRGDYLVPIEILDR